MDTITAVRNHILQLCGEREITGRWVAHAGNLDTYFDRNTEIKECFLSGMLYKAPETVKEVYTDEELSFVMFKPFSRATAHILLKPP